ncbi:MAG: preprotein translocase subunit SecE [Phycisphaerae bacterium]|jgi:preprotein translocase subunit SecE|nr:preprotein translocase subunit SecE [Phycisphaerae bacterium]
MFKIYKVTQGRYTRSLTFAGAMLVALSGAYVLSGKLYDASAYVRYGLPLLVVILIALLAFWMVNRPRNADFLIATEGEMKKVSWSGKKEIIGSTKVVIVTTLMIAMLLFGVDILFGALFKIMGMH